MKQLDDGIGPRTPLRLTLRQLQIFAVVAQSGTTAAAAGIIALSQSATSAAINELERVLDLQLFDRSGKRLLLNDNGRALLPRALELLDGAQGIERWAGDRLSQGSALRIGASTTIGNYLLPDLLAGYRERLPAAARGDWRIRVVIANTATIAAQVAAFELDLGLLEGPCREPTLTVVPWLEDELVILAAPDDPIAMRGRRGRVGLAALRDATWLLREAGSGTRAMIHELLVPHLQGLHVGIEFSNSEAIKRATASGLGLTCLSRCAVEDQLRTGALVALHTPLPRMLRRFSIVTHQHKRATPGMARLLDYLAGAQRRSRSTGQVRMPSRL